MSTPILLYQMNPWIYSVQRMESDNHKTEYYMRAYCSQLFYISEGHGFLQHTGGYLSLRPGTVVLVDAGIPYNIIAYTSETLNAVQVCFDYTMDNRQKDGSILSVPARCYHEKRSFNDIVPSEAIGADGCICIGNMQHLSIIFDNMHDICARAHSFHEALLSGYLKTLICGLFAGIAAHSGREYDERREHIVWDVFSYIDQNYMKDITNASIAAYLNYHPNYLNKQMVYYTGKSLHQHLIAYRVSRATELLLFSSASIHDIALSTGFNSSCHFTKAFQASVGCAPSSLRLMYFDATQYTSRVYDEEALRQHG